MPIIQFKIMRHAILTKNQITENLPRKKSIKNSYIKFKIIVINIFKKLEKSGDFHKKSGIYFLRIKNGKPKIEKKNT